MNANIIISTILEERTPKKDGTFPVKLRLTYQRRQRYYKTGISLSKEAFEFIMHGTPKGKLRDKKLYINAYEQKAQDAVEALKEFSFVEFRKQFLGLKKREGEVFHLFETYVKTLKGEGRVKTASSYESASRSIKIFCAGKILNVSDITPDFLKRYEKKMLDSGKSITTVGIYMRSLRIIVNLALSKGIIQREEYPFGRHKFVIPSGKNIKKAFSAGQIKKLFGYKCKSGGEEKAKDFWVFSYLCNGINMKDIARLKGKDIHDGMIHFIRAKTEHTSRTKLKPVTVYISSDLKRIISKWRQKNNSDENYVFPILEEGLTPEREARKIEQFIKTTNKYLKRIGESIGLNIPLTTYSARHSYATMLKRSGVPLPYISDSLGHSNMKTTESYFDGFEDNVKKQYASLLTNFRKK